MSQPRQTIIFSKVAMDQEQMKKLTELFAHPGFALLRQIIGAHSSEAQVNALEASLYSDFSDEARIDAQDATRRAISYSKTLEILDEISAQKEAWFTAKLDSRP